MGDLSLPREGETAREKPLLAPRSRPWVFVGGDRHDRCAVYSPRPRPTEVWSPMPPSATDSLLSPLSSSSLELIPGLVVLSENSGTATTRVPNTCGMRSLGAVEKTLAALTQFLAASPRPQHCGLLLERRRLSVSLMEVWGRCLPNTRGGGGRPPYAPRSGRDRPSPPPH